GGALDGVGHRFPADGGPVLDQAVVGAVHHEAVGAGGGLVGEGRAPRVVRHDLLHRDARAVLDVRVRGRRGGGAVGVAQLHGEGVGGALLAGGGRPRVGGAAAHLDVEVQAGEGDAAGADPGALDLLE